MFESLGELKFEFQPKFQDKTPDFLLHNQFGESVVADVTVLHGGPTEEYDRQRGDPLCLRREVMTAETDNFAPEIVSMSGNRTVKEQGGGPVSFKKLLPRIRTWIREQEDAYVKSPTELLWQQSRDGGRCVNEYFGFEELGINLRLFIRLNLKEEETKEQRKFRQMLLEGRFTVSPVSVDNTDDRLEVALKKKISYLKKFKHPQSEKGSLPYMIVIFNSDPLMPDKEDLQKVFFGPSNRYYLDSRVALDDLRQWQLRTGQELRSYSEGIFTNRRKDLLAVLVCKGHIVFPDSCEMSMWVNPYASCFRIPQSLYQLKTYTLNREIVCTPPA